MDSPFPYQTWGDNPWRGGGSGTTKASTMKLVDFKAIPMKPGLHYDIVWPIVPYSHQVIM